MDGPAEAGEGSARGARPGLRTPCSASHPLQPPCDAEPCKLNRSCERVATGVCGRAGLPKRWSERAAAAGVDEPASVSGGLISAARAAQRLPSSFPTP